MEQASAVELRKCLVLADELVKIGVSFIPMPVFDETDRQAQIAEMNRRLEKMAVEAEQAEAGAE